MVQTRGNNTPSGGQKSGATAAKKVSEKRKSTGGDVAAAKKLAQVPASTTDIETILWVHPKFKSFFQSCFKQENGSLKARACLRFFVRVGHWKTRCLDLPSETNNRRAVANYLTTGLNTTLVTSASVLTWINKERSTVWTALTGAHLRLLDLWLETDAGKSFQERMDSNIAGGFNLQRPYIFPGKLKEFLQQSGLIADVYRNILDVVVDNLFESTEGRQWVSAFTDATAIVLSELITECYEFSEENGLQKRESQIPEQLVTACILKGDAKTQDVPFPTLLIDTNWPTMKRHVGSFGYLGKAAEAEEVETIDDDDSFVSEVSHSLIEPKFIKPPPNSIPEERSSSLEEIGAYYQEIYEADMHSLQTVKAGIIQQIEDLEAEAQKITMFAAARNQMMTSMCQDLGAVQKVSAKFRAFRMKLGLASRNDMISAATKQFFGATANDVAKEILEYVSGDSLDKDLGIEESSAVSRFTVSASTLPISPGKDNSELGDNYRETDHEDGMVLDEEDKDDESSPGFSATN
ncbi:hypothetical protein AOL_s00081g265 [Orbilia oligospora ATCC 24927]|uniref:Uncharacterized protein n=1 Tax=Arthrobotrys oligospora (strain ATCC 24927 / CBS 115.81 / DSM 1491) TaxID=756982 RepID=G1XFX2_ARTOA|nr:hypothetical protein AOL_s00081g265 [Orbilia oligospora ATCC 24927]EGX47938.1 hypothetical protein AOL_s00081g265 [Orbilia oligospora ATCC 24927]